MVFEPLETDTNCALVLESIDNVSDAPNSSNEELSEAPRVKDSTSVRLRLFDFSLAMKSRKCF